MNAAFISSLIGAASAGIVLVLKQLFTKNQNKELTYTHEERLIELVSQQNNSSQQLVGAIQSLTTEMELLKHELNGLNQRITKLEEEKKES